MYFKKLRNQFLFCAVLILCTLFSGIGIVRADESTSASYKVLDPVVNSGGYGTSAGFSLYGLISEIGDGVSTSASFGNNAGFLYFPYASTPAVSISAGNGQVDLSWIASTGLLGWTAASYSIGQASVSGGPYSYSSVGNVTSSSRTGLSNGTTYYFVIVVKDTFGNSIATSTQVSATPAGTSGNNGTTGGTGGTGGNTGTPPGKNGVVFSGRAYPRSTVTILKDGQVAASTVADATANFQVTLSGLSAGSYTFSVYGQDSGGLRSTPISFPVTVTEGVTINVGGIFISPTISTDKSEVRKGDNIAIFGQSTVQSEIVIQINSDQEFFVKTNADKNGVYLKNFDTSPLEMGQHSTKSKSSIENEISSFGQTASFIVGTKNVAKVATNQPEKGNLNGDDRINLVDFSIAAFWYKRPLNADMLAKEKKCLNGDGKIDLVDFSIMAYNWTG